jgi:hypothetical protein
LSAPADRAGDLDGLLAHIATCGQFVHLEPLEDELVRNAVLALLNLDADTRADVLLFIDRHYYLMRLEVMQMMDVVTRETRAGAARGRSARDGDWRCAEGGSSARRRRRVEKGELVLPLFRRECANPQSFQRQQDA